MPLSVGVFGNWGAGKLTILELTKKSLESDSQNENEYIQIHLSIELQAENEQKKADEDKAHAEYIEQLQQKEEGYAQNQGVNDLRIEVKKFRKIRDELRSDKYVVTIEEYIQKLDAQFENRCRNFDESNIEQRNYNYSDSGVKR